MAIHLIRSPFYITGNTSSPNAVYAELELRISTYPIYTIKKNKDTANRVLFEISELLRDYLYVNYDSVGTHSLPFDFTLTWKDANGGFITASGGSGFISDGYGYFEQGYNPISQKALLQSNSVTYRLQDSDVRIPVDVNEATKVVYISNGKIIKEYPIASQTDKAISYVGSNIDSFKERVTTDGGVYEYNDCIFKFDGSVDLNKVDTIRVFTSNGFEDTQVKTISECRYAPIKLSFVNRYGAIQELWFFRKSIESLSSTSEKYKSNITTLFGSYDTKEHQIRNFNVQSNSKITLNTGYVDESYNEPMKELMQSERVWIEIDNVVKPMNLTTRNLTFKTRANDKLVDYTIELDYAFDGIQNVR